MTLKHQVPILIILATAAVLIFANLGNQYLWQDEAETAVLAERVLEFGYPKAFDGKNLVNPFIRTGYGPGHSWLYHPWGQFYITALSFKLFGVNTFTARLPFALMGVLNVLVLYMLAMRLTGKRFIAICSAGLMSASVPYLLLMRQCRYYAPAVLLVLLALLFYTLFSEKRRTGYLFLVSACLVLLCYTVHGMFIPLSAALGLHYVLFNLRKDELPRVAGLSFLVAAAVLPWFLFSNSTVHAAPVSPEKLWKNLEFQVRMINKYIFPAMFFAGMYAVRGVFRKRFSIELEPAEKKAMLLFGCVVLVSMAAFCFAEERNFRYLVYFIPLFAVAQGMILLRLFAFSRLLFASFISVSLLTGVFNMGYPNFFLPKYLYEITHDYDGPIEGIAKFLNERAKPGETVKIIFGDIPLMFYTDLAVDNSNVYNDQHMPEWIVFRHGWHEQLDNDYYTKVKKTYRQHVLEYPDIKWENRPGDLVYHRFWTDREAPRVVLFERIER